MTWIRRRRMYEQACAAAVGGFRSRRQPLNFGVDVGTRVAIYKFIAELCEAGAAILLISSDLPEILHLSSRAYVMHRGALRAELTGSEISEERVLSHFFEREAA